MVFLINQEDYVIGVFHQVVEVAAQRLALQLYLVQRLICQPLPPLPDEPDASKCGKQQTSEESYNHASLIAPPRKRLAGIDFSYHIPRRIGDMLQGS